MKERRFEDALRNYERAFELTRFVWLLATSPDESIRDGLRAVGLATRAVQATGGGRAAPIDAFAAAYAEAGDFQSAVKTQRRAIELASKTEVDKYRQRLDAYRRNQPWRGKPVSAGGR